MAIVYFDASALVKLLIDEEGTAEAVALWDHCDVPISSRLVYPEVCAALAAGHRSHALDDQAHQSATRHWERNWQTIWPVELTPEVTQRAGDLAVSRSLRGADAVHLASALAIGVDEIVLAVWDGRLHSAAEAEGLAVAPAHLN